MTNILGISAFYHDSAASIIVNGDITAAAQEERFTRIKHDASFPTNAIKYCLNENNLSLRETDYVVFYEKPFLKFERILETYVATAPKSFRSFAVAIPLWIREKLFQKNLLINQFKEIDNKFSSKKIMFSEHHFSHAASAFYPSPFEEAIILTIDGVGEWATTTVSIGKKNEIKIIKEINFPHSLGLLYSAFTYYLGFKINSGEYKVMGLAPYGKPIYENLILDNLIDLKEDGSFKLDQAFFNYTTGLTMTNNKFSNLFKHKKREPEKENLKQFHMDIAASIQSITEKIIIKLTRSLSKKYSIPNLCLAGGVALNCVANSKILQDQHFENIWIQPASGDAGGSLGAALAFWYKELGKERILNNGDSMKGSYLGPSYRQNDIEKDLKDCGANFELCDDEKVIQITAEEINGGKAVGWFQGRMEFGPRALGCRSILADPRKKNMQKILNLKIKYRESFRPFAPSIIKEDLKEWFDLKCDSPYMLLVGNVKKDKIIDMNKKDNDLFGIDKLNIVRSSIPAVTHVDHSARIQTVDRKTNYKYYLLIKKFKELTGCPILVNTSFNVRGEPIVNTVKDAFKCFMGTEMDMLIIENYILYKNKQSSLLKEDYKHKYELD